MTAPQALHSALPSAASSDLAFPFPDLGSPVRLSWALSLPLVLGVAMFAGFSLLCLGHISFPLTLGLLAEPPESHSWVDSPGWSPSRLQAL